MFFSSRVFSSAAAITLTCLVTAATYYYSRRRSEINEVMVFCKLQFNVFNYFDKLIGFVESAKNSVNVCMPGINNPAIQARLIEILKRKTIQIKILIDRSGYNEFTSAFIDELKEAGAEIHWKSTNIYKIQHKFCLVDNSVLMTGTLDWGDDLSSDNWNYVLITNKPQLVKPVVKEFSHLWETCAPDICDT